MDLVAQAFATASSGVESRSAVEEPLCLGIMVLMADDSGGGASHEEGGAYSILAVETAEDRSCMAYMV